MFEFEWDSTKSASNLRKHEISFELAATVFQDPLSTSILDHDHGASEERWITMGYTRNSRLLVVSHTWTQDPGGRVLIRLISARPATRNERREYESGK